jgi:hypothetical protein
MHVSQKPNIGFVRKGELRAKRAGDVRIHTKTGKLVALAGVKTERKRQSSVPKPEELKL